MKAHLNWYVINYTLIWRALKQVGKGERSRVVNHALTEWLCKHKRCDAARKMDALRNALPPVSAAWVREERERAL